MSRAVVSLKVKVALCPRASLHGHLQLRILSRPGVGTSVFFRTGYGIFAVHFILVGAKRTCVMVLLSVVNMFSAVYDEINVYKMPYVNDKSGDL